MMKKLLAAFVLVAFSFCAFAQEEDTEFDDFDSLFEDAVDIEEPVQNEQAVPVTPVVSSSSYTPNIRLSGHVNAAIGYGIIINNGFQQSGYLDFNNSLSAVANPSANTSLHASISNNVSNGGLNIAFSSLYLDYNLWSKFFISVGKKGLSWTSMRLFDGNTVASYVGSSTMMGSVNYPKGKMDLTFVGMINGTASDVSLTNVHYAGQFNYALWGTLLSLQAHQYHPTKAEKPTTVALELKRTIAGYDAYAHTDTSLKLGKNMTTQSFTSLNSIAGFYRLWDSPNIGINAELHHVYNFASSANTFELKEQFGWNKLCNNRLALAFDGSHNFNAKTGSVTLGAVVKNVFPSANLQNGLTMNYAPAGLDFTIGTKFSLSLDY